MKKLIDKYYKYRNRTFHQNNRKYLIKNYVENFNQHKLQIGCQGQVIKGWLNVDIEPKSREVALMDATKSFPFGADTFSYIFTEHMIEHVSYKEAELMLKECYRVMKTGGVLRISTPNLKFLMELYSESKTEVQKAYIQESKRYIKDQLPLTATSVINNFFKDWGHQYIHDFESLQLLLMNAGFKDVIEVSVGQSKHVELQGLEKHGNEIGNEFNLLESIVVEAEK
jgi:predicted SAM-dependent methyltransferase